VGFWVKVNGDVNTARVSSFVRPGGGKKFTRGDWLGQEADEEAA